MAWSTSVVAPPDGAMRHYMASLEKLLARDDKIYWTGHGGPVKEPQRFVRALLPHRHARETAILSRFEAGDSTIANVYEGLDPALTNAAAASVRAHIEDLVERGMVGTEERWRLAPSIDRHRA